MGKQAFAQVREIAIGMSGERHALVHLDDVHIGPRQRLIGQRTQHRPCGVTANDGHDEAAARGDGRTCLPGGECRSRPRHRVGIGQRFDPHDLTVGFCQPPGGETRASTSFGPQVPGSYSQTGVPAFSRGSTIRQASST
jgi:hypothetical protein